MKIGRLAGFILLSLLAATFLAACGGGDGAPAVVVDPPVVTTGAATSDSQDNAVLNGTVNPNGAATNFWFEYGTDNALATYTASTASSAGSGASASPVTDTIVGLTANTTYYYRVAASNSGGTSRGSILSFATLPDPPTVTTISAAPNPDNAVLNGTVNPNGAATNFWFEYGTDNALATSTSTTPQSAGTGISAVAVTDEITGLAATTTYYFRVAATNSGGTSRGAILSFTTPALPPPVADAGPDQTVFMRGPSGPNSATLTAAGSSDPDGTITGYLWTQLSGPAATLDNNTAVDPSFTVPQFPYGAAQNLVFQVVVTDNDAFSSTDLVNVSVNWGWLDDFSTDTTATYTVVEDPAPNAGAFSYGAGVASVTTGVGNSIYFSKLFGLGANGPTGYTAKFSISYTPTASYNVAGGVVVTLGDDTNTYYRISTRPGEHFVEKWRAGVKVDDSGSAFAGTINLGDTYLIALSFTRRTTTVQAFGQTITLVGEDNPVPITYFGVLTQERDATFDNVKLEYLAP